MSEKQAFFYVAIVDYSMQYTSSHTYTTNTYLYTIHYALDLKRDEERIEQSSSGGNRAMNWANGSNMIVFACAIVRGLCCVLCVVCDVRFYLIPF